jgi:hypothetical protein
MTVCLANCKGTWIMANRLRKFCLESLEGRQLLSHMVALPAGDVSTFVALSQKTMSVVGSIAAEIIPPDHWGGSGKLPGLGLVQMAINIPEHVDQGAAHSAMTLSTSKGKLTFAIVEKVAGPMKLTLQKGTKSFAGWNGGGTVTSTLDQLLRNHEPTYEMLFQLKLKT